MKFLLPNNQEIEIPDNFHPVPYLSDDGFYEICFFREDVLTRITWFAYYKEPNETKGRQYNVRNYNRYEDWCYDIKDLNSLEPGIYELCFTYDYETDEYVMEKYEIHNTSSN